MPELPEVETVRRTLEQLVLEEKIIDVTVKWDNIIQFPKDIDEFKHLIIGQVIHKIGRRGKFLLFYLDSHVLISHLRMEGKYGLYPNEEPLSKHAHVIFQLENNKQLRYQDVRKFGTMHLYPMGQEFERPPLNKLGYEPFEESFTEDFLYQRLKKTNRAVKTALLDQSIVVGLGNIYVDEALYRSGIHPMRLASSIKKKEIPRLYEQIKKTLAEAIQAGGTTIRSYVNSQGQIGMFQQKLYVYGKQGEACQQCGRLIEKTKVGGRGTHICPSCQKI